MSVQAAEQWKKRRSWAKEIQGWLFTSPYLIFTIIFFLIPLVWSIFLVFQNWNLISPHPTFIGLKNFQEALASPRVWQAFFVSYKFLILFIPLVMAASIGLALIVHSIPRFKSLFAVGFFLPYLASGVVSTLVVQGILSYDGPFNATLRSLFGVSIDWLNNGWTATLVIVLLMVWKFSGYYALIFLSGLQGIPDEIYEAASIDGANAWVRFWRITLPMLYPAFYTVLILAVGLMFSIFTEPFLLTKGGPNMATQTWQLEIYYQAFNQFRSGYGATVALINAVVTLVSIVIIRRIVEAWGRRYGW
ncbi:multiple sugar transport system permease protein [Thermosporothrix hazakensis]|jgi:multiple sugar transport system permease protein|uniref:Multiple sugar transport system permease protein n=2 Tax=Thermosporothrix TaxID=768650 RepID=A0A326U5L7_THEHA|nr:sugar ABC transporter permease [Thermosporothrix hazakensis]PZW29230.1 multiple sugar transport system permease protein [Thermosporothrix hazakensis]BBH86161.1 sugar ABC transporter permease [Thermosporothrix sp. COM3]GCE45417.1 sugar ABC transporter permease [Thermosporothrix hazakensis]